MEKHLPGCTSSQKHQLLVTVLDPQHWDFLPIMGPLASPYPWRCPRNGDESGPRILPCLQLPAPIIPEVVPGPGGVQGWTPPCECSSSPAPSTPSSPIPTDVMASVSRSLLVSRILRMGPMLQEHRAGTPIPSARRMPWSGGGCCHRVLLILLILLFLLPAGWRLSGEQQQETTGRDN